MKDFFLADDLSGALDAAAAFHHAGRRVKVALSSVAAWSGAEGDVLALTTETRNKIASAAAAIVENALAEARRQGARVLYKKIDSTLRGPVAAEVKALARALPEARILFAPANPAAGRTVRGGVLFVRGVPVAESEFGRDPAAPVVTSDIRTLLGDAAMERIVVPDAETDADLAAAVDAMEAAGEPWVGVGSGALVRFIAQKKFGLVHRPLDPLPAGAPENHRDPPRQSCLFLCGSAHPVNRAQAALLERERGVRTFVLPSGSDALKIEPLSDAIGAGSAAILIDERRGDSAALLRAMTSAADVLVSATGCRRLFVTGGETAFSLCGRLGIEALQFKLEVEAGLSVSTTARGSDPFRIAVKNGGFGDERTWLRAWDALQRA